MTPARVRYRYNRTIALGVDDPEWWCAACGDDDHEDHVDVYVDIHGAESACCCPTCV